MPKNKKPSADLRKAARQLARTAPRPDDRVVDSSGSNGTVMNVGAGVVKVQHDNGTIAYHSLGAVRKVTPAPPDPAPKSKKK